MELMWNTLIPVCMQQMLRVKLRCNMATFLMNHCIRLTYNFVLLLYIENRAYPVYVGDYTTGTQQYYATTNEYTTSASHQNESYIVEEALLTGQSRESPQTIAGVSL